MVTRHSKQIPIAQRGPRASPPAERRNFRIPAFQSAAATDIPARAGISRPSTRIEKERDSFNVFLRA